MVLHSLPNFIFVEEKTLYFPTGGIPISHPFLVSQAP